MVDGGRESRPAEADLRSQISLAQPQALERLAVAEGIALPVPAAAD